VGHSRACLWLVAFGSCLIDVCDHSRVCTGITARRGRSSTRDDVSPYWAPADLLNIILLKSRETTMDRKLDVSTAPRDGTPVILWIDDDEAPPVFLVTVEAWEEDPIAGVNYWRVFGAKGMPSLYFDQHVQGWMPLPPPHSPYVTSAPRSAPPCAAPDRPRARRGVVTVL